MFLLEIEISSTPFFKNEMFRKLTTADATAFFVLFYHNIKFTRL